MTDLRPDLVHFGIVVNGWCRYRSRSKKVNGLANAKNLIDRMHKLYSTGNEWLQPNIIVYNNLIMSHAKRGQVEETEKLFKEIERHYNDGNSNVKPNVLTLNFMIDAISKSYDKGKSNKSPRDAYKLVNRVQTEYGVIPDVITYNLCINAWAKSGQTNAGREAENILKVMIERVKLGFENAKPDIFTYNQVLNAWSKSSEDGAAQRAQDVLEAMEQMYYLGYEGLKPNLRSYSSVINAWSKSYHPEAGKFASSLLGRMIDLYNQGHKDLKPDVVTYTGVMQAMVKDSSVVDIQVVRKVTKMLKYVEKLYDRTGDVSIRPDRSLYNVVVRAWQKFPGGEGARRTREIRKQMNLRNISTYRNPIRRNASKSRLELVTK